MAMKIWTILLLLFCFLQNSAQCPSKHWRCQNGQCIVTERRCNGWDSCGDNSDEQNCASWKCPAGEDWWQCREKQCIPKHQRCTGERRDVTDCPDHSDEENCDTLYNGHLSITPEQLILKGRENVTLACNASDAYSQPSDFAWDIRPCRHRSADNTCTLTLDPQRDEGRRVTCTATRTDSNKKVLARGSQSLVLNILTLPQDQPVIRTPRPGSSYILEGDVLTCTVYGGRPLVSAVHFSCTNPPLPDGQDVKTTSSVASSVTLNTTEGVTGHVRCSCSATWSPKPELYQTATDVVLQIGYPPMDRPVFGGRSSRRKYLLSGDVMTCTVYGGRPLVTAVHFSCSDPPLPDGQDVRTTSYVFSNITLNTTDDDTDHVRCSCSATWSPRPELFDMVDAVTFDMRRPPADRPVITTPSADSPYILDGDVLTCTVHGGRPLVSAVYFTCSDPPTPDGEDVETTSSVASSVTTYASDDVTGHVMCMCSATWSPNPELYTLVATSSFIIGYPPLDRPVIRTTPTGRSYLLSGDVLTCTVYGGRPLVSAVHFSCTNPPLPDGPDVKTTSSVASSVTLQTTDDVTGHVRCNCSATWSPRPELYQKTDAATYSVGRPE